MAVVPGVKWPCLASRNHKLSAIVSEESQEELEEEPLVPNQRPQLCVLTTEEGWKQAAS